MSGTDNEITTEDSVDASSNVKDTVPVHQFAEKLREVRQFGSSIGKISEEESDDRMHDVTQKITQLMQRYQSLADTIADQHGEVFTDIQNSEVAQQMNYTQLDDRKIQRFLQRVVQIAAIHDVSTISSAIKQTLPQDEAHTIDEAIQGVFEGALRRNSFNDFVATHFSEGHDHLRVPKRDALRLGSETWHMVKASPLMREAFGPEIQAYDDQIFHILETTAMQPGADGELAAIQLGYYDPPAEVIQRSLRNLFVSAVSDVEKAKHLLARYEQRPDWESIVAAAEQSDPVIKRLRALPPKLDALFGTSQYVLRALITRNEQMLMSDDRDFINLRAAVDANLETVYVHQVLAQDASTSDQREAILAELQEKVALIKERVPGFFPLTQAGGPLQSNSNLLWESLLNDENFLAEAQKITNIFTQDIPYWKQLFTFMELRVGGKFRNASTDYPLLFIPRMLDEQGNEVSFNEDFHFDRIPVTIGGQQLAEMLDLSNLPADTDIDNLTHVPFSWLKLEYKKATIAYGVHNTIEASRDNDNKTRADTRNRSLAQSSQAIKFGDHLHISAIDFLGSTLRNGNLPAEALGATARSDVYPFQVDLLGVTSETFPADSNLDEFLKSSNLTDWGTRHSLGNDGQMVYIYDLQDHDMQPVPQKSTFRNHKVLLGGIPATETTGIILRNPQVTKDKAIKEILQNGFYIPIYNMAGELLFTPQTYDSLRENGNYTIKVDIWDSSYKIGESKNGIDGGEYVIPSSEGPKSYYVAFHSKEDHIWNNQLADNLYRRYGLAVPDSKIVRMGDIYGHARETVIPDEEQNTSGRKNGFIMDAFLGNWNVLKNDAVVASAGQLHRISSESALLYGSLGDQKKAFTSRVLELETMRDAYDGLNGEDIQAQLSIFAETITDEAIDEEVDNVRLPSLERNKLKLLLRQRRDYILGYNFQQQNSESSVEVNETGQHFMQLLLAESFSDPEMMALTPEWERFTGEKGFEHNKRLLGTHLRETIQTLKRLPEFTALSSHEQSLALLAMFFHDFGKPTGNKTENVFRDFEHEIPSAFIASEYMTSWGFPMRDIKEVMQVILYDGVVTDIVRGEVSDHKKDFMPEALQERLLNQSVIRMLRAVNKSDGIATVGNETFSKIGEQYNAFFDQMVASQSD